MAHLRMNRTALRTNHAELERRMAGHGVDYGIVTKLLCGHTEYLREVLALRPAQVMDARTSNLRAVKELDPDATTAYIKPPAPGNAEDVVRWADVSFNTELATLRALDAEAARQGVRHGIVIMVEMGDLREGVMREQLVEFVGDALAFENLDLRGLGTNFNCLNATVPNEDKLWQLALFRELVELRYGVELAWVSGGTSITLPMLFEGRVPSSINHFRIGEGLFFGRDLDDGGVFDGMRDDVFELVAEVIEVAEKPAEPSGPFGEDPFGEGHEPGDNVGGTVRRAILDVGWLEVEAEFLSPVDDGVEILDVSSDMTVVDVSDRAGETRVGDQLRFRLRYMGALKLLNSDYVDKIVVEDDPEHPEDRPDVRTSDHPVREPVAVAADACADHDVACASDSCTLHERGGGRDRPAAP